MRLALLTEADVRKVKQSHVSRVGVGRWRIVAEGVKSKLSVCYSLPTAIMAQKPVSDTLEFDGPCSVIITVEEKHPEDTRISVYAERVA